jgi:alkaline phosphatase D
MKKNACFLIFTLILFSTFVVAQSPIGRDSTLPFDATLKPFYHGVASGDPLADRVIIWTRVTPEQDQTINGSYVMATDTLLKNVVKTGTFSTNNTLDYTVKIDVLGLAANTTYYYAFTAFGKRSMIGRTKTTPSVSAANLTDVLKFAVVSCTNYEGGYFSSYGRIADRNDLNAVLFLGDYIYEYSSGGYDNPQLNDPNRKNVPTKEIISKTDYRTRYSLYHLDKNLQRAHQQHPFICIWDDHETANNSFENGAQNHQPATEGDWQTRKNLAREAYYEWIPIRGQANVSTLYRRFSYGNLMDLMMLDTRLEGRQEPPVNFDDVDSIANPRRMMSKTQLNWLVDNLKTTTARWKLIGNQIVFSDINVGFAASNPRDIASIRTLENGFNDFWKGYPIQRNALIDSLKTLKINNTVFVSGDSHASWAFDVTKKPTNYPSATTSYIPQTIPYNATTGEGYTGTTGEGSYAVEFCGPSITSQNFDEILGAALTNSFNQIINNPIPSLGNANYNPHMKYVDLSNHGYFILDVRADSTQADYFFIPNVYTNTTTETWARGVVTRHNSNRISNTNAPTQAARKTVQDAPAPSPSVIISGVKDLSEAVIFTLYPNPTANMLHINYGLSKTSNVSIHLTNIEGKTVKTVRPTQKQTAGIYELNDCFVGDLESGVYFLNIKTEDSNVARKIVVQR